MNLNVLLSLVTCLLLTACSTYKENFDCPPGSGVGCKSITAVDQLIDKGKLPHPEKPIPLDPSIQRSEINSNDTPRVIAINADEQTQLTQHGILRVPEQVMALWVKGYLDASGNYHSDSVVYTVVRPASWSVR